MSSDGANAYLSLGKENNSTVFDGFPGLNRSVVVAILSKGWREPVSIQKNFMCITGSLVYS